MKECLCTKAEQKEGEYKALGPKKERTQKAL